MVAAINEGLRAGLTDQASILNIAGFMMPLKGSRENLWNAFVALNVGDIPDGGMSFHLTYLRQFFLNQPLVSGESSLYGNPGH